jgi:O-antigen/teichoic acid export membrane protein
VCRRDLALTPRFSLQDARDMFSASYYQFFTSVALRIQSKADVFFVGWLLGPQSAAIYNLTARAQETMQMLSGNAAAALDAPLAHLHGSGNVARFREVLRTTVVLTALAGALGMAGVAAWNESFVTLWVGSDLFAGQTTSVLLALAGFLAVSGGGPYLALMARGDFRAISRAYLISVLIHVPLLVIFTPLGLWGAALATALAALVRTAMLSEALMRSMEQRLATLRREAGRIVTITLPPFAAAALVILLAPVPAHWVWFGVAVTVFSLAAISLTWLANRRLLGLLVREVSMSLGALRART